MRQAEAIFCMLLALAVHFGFWLWPSEQGVSSSGSGGEALVSLEASSASIAELIEEWDNPVLVTDTNPILASHEPAPDSKVMLTTSSHENTTSPPKRLDLSKPVLADLPNFPSLDMKPPSAPTLRKQPKAARPSAASIALSKQVAAGVGQQQAQGMRGPSEASNKEAKQKAALMAKWGARIRSSIERRKRYPRGTKANGTTQIQLTVTPNGGLVALRIRRSSGIATLDKAALAAVRAARFPHAPNNLPGKQHTFNIPISFLK